MDLIDRQALLKQIEIDSDGEPGYYGDTWKFIDTIKNLPSATDNNVGTKLGTNLAEVGKDCISREAVADAINGIECTRHTTWYEFYQKVMTAVEKLPSAEPKRGRWVLVCDNNGMHFICNKCGAWRYHQEQKFCGECGADMRQKGENNESN